MNKNIALLKIFTDETYNINNINKILPDFDYEKSQLIKKAFKTLNQLIYSLSIHNDWYCVRTIKRNIEFISFLCDEEKFTDEEVIINKNRIKKARESILAYANKYKDSSLFECANILDEIVLDKYIDLSDLMKLLKELISRKEDSNIIKKFISINKGIIILDKNEMFDYVFNLCINSIVNESRDAFYYITLLKLLYNSKIDKDKYITILNNKVKKDSLLKKEVFLLLSGIKRGLTPDEILEKYNIKTELNTSGIILSRKGAINEKIITIDEKNTSLKDDGISIKKDGSNYIVGIHIADAGKSITPNSRIDLDARNNFKCVYMARGIRLFSDNIENSLSLNQGENRNVLTLYVVLNDSGDIIDYYIKENEIIVSRNLTYLQGEKMINHYDANGLEKSLSELFMLAKALEYRDPQKRNYWKKKDESKSDKKKIADSKSDMIVREFMVLYNTLVGEITKNNNIPYIYKYQNEEYLSKLVKELKIKTDDETNKIIRSTYLDSRYSSSPRWHSGLGKISYTQSTDPLRKYPDLYTQYLLHAFYFNDLELPFDQESFEKLINYFNRRNEELSLMKSEYNRELRLIKKD